MTTKVDVSFLYASVISAGLALLPFSTALAANEGTIEVSANVIATCTIDGGSADLTFVDYDPGDTAPKDASTSFTFQCSAETTAYISLSGGANNDDGTRHMAKDDDASELLEYALYQDTAGGTLFGNDTALGDRKQFVVAANTAQLVDVHGRIPALQPVPTGDYSDTVQISIEF